MQPVSCSTPYARLGGAAAVERLVDRLYHWMEVLPEARTVHAMHRSDMAEVKARVGAFLVSFLGGPDLYRPTYGEPMMCRRHASFAIGPAEREEWMRCFDRALDEVVEDPALREQVRRAVGAMAERIRNRGTAAAPACGTASCQISR